MNQFLSVTFSLLITASLLHSQPVNNEKKKIVGKNLISQKEIVATEYTFPNRIDTIIINNTDSAVTLVFRDFYKHKAPPSLKNKGIVALYNLNKKNTQWTNEIQLKKTQLIQIKDLLLFSSKKGTFINKILDGKTIWHSITPLIFGDYTQNIGMSFASDLTGVHANTLLGKNLSSGKIIWQREMQQAQGWKNITYINDSTLIVTAEGLYSINIKNGTGWNYKTPTSQKKHIQQLVRIFKDSYIKISPYIYFTTTNYNMLEKISSNTIVIGEHIYFASKEMISKINVSNGNAIWTTPLPVEITGTSFIFIKDSTLYIISKGYALNGNIKINHGQPYFAAFDIKTGKQTLFNTLSQKESLVIDCQIKENTLFLLFYNKIISIDILTGKILGKTINVESADTLSNFTSKKSYHTSDNISFVNTVSADSTKNYASLKSGNILVFDENLNTIDVINSDKTYKYALQFDDYKILIHKKQTILLNHENRGIAEFEKTKNTTIVGKTMYYSKDNTLIEIKLKEILNGNQK